MYLIFSVVFSSTTFAQTPYILKLDQYSGYTAPQHAMEAHCTFDSSLRISSKISKERTEDGWKIETVINEIKTESEFAQVQSWINEAAVGPFKQGANPCDIGTVKITTEAYPLLVSQDCGKKIENQHPSAKLLITWFRQACGLPGARR
jgi:hypothetical protein